MKVVYNTHVRKLKEVKFHQCRDDLANLLQECRGSKVVFRVVQNGKKIDIHNSGPDFEGTLQDCGVDTSKSFDAEILIRDPATYSRGFPGSFRDNSDWNALHWNGERGTGNTIESPLRNTPMFFRENGSSIDLIDHFGGTGSSKAVFLVMNGKSFGAQERALLSDRKGLMTFTVNNGGHEFRSDFWACVDDPARFMRSIWEDGRMMKFVPMAHFEKRVWDESRKDFSVEKVKNFPNVVGYRRNEAFHPSQWLLEDTINWGNHSKRGGGRSVMLVALRIAWLLGFRRVYLVGCDFEMTKESRYWFPEQRTDGAIRNNMNSYSILSDFFSLLVPEFQKVGFEVFNCNPTSKLTVFPHADLAEAIESVAVDVSGSTEGMYVKR